jgi:hypothetical protein
MIGSEFLVKEFRQFFGIPLFLVYFLQQLISFILLIGLILRNFLQPCMGRFNIARPARETTFTARSGSALTRTKTAC